MELPNELKAPPPRDPQHAGPFLAKSRGNARNVMLSGLALMPAMVALMWLKFGTVDALSIGISVGVGGLVTVLGAAMMTAQARAKNLFVLGHATLAKVTLVQSSGDGSGAAYTRLDVELTDGHGRATGTAMVMGVQNDVDVAVGDSIVALTHDGFLAVHTPKLGMHVGRLKR
jgi:hypothetical protein